MEVLKQIAKGEPHTVGALSEAKIEMERKGGPCIGRLNFQIQKSACKVQRFEEAVGMRDCNKVIC